MISSESEVITFGPFSLDLRVERLYREQNPVHLPPRAVAVLEHLARRPGQDVSKEELLDAVWDGTHVSEDSLTQAVSLIRKALGDDPKTPTYIQTLPGHGYRFIGRPGVDSAGEVPPGKDDPEAAAERRRNRVRPFGAATLALVLIVVGYGATRLLAPGPSAPAGEPIESVAVLPFENRTGDPEMAYLSSGIPEVLSNRLATIPGLRVAPRGFAFRFGRALEDPREVAEKLEVRGVVSGWVDVVEGRLVVGVELVDAARMAHLWGDTYTRSRGDLIGLQSTVAHDIARELRPELDANEERRVGRSFTDDTLAYELYLKARQATYAGEGNRENLRKALDLTRKCVDRDPSFAQAHALAAELQAMLGFWNFRPHEEVLPGARHAALAALEIEPRLAEPRAVLGWSKAVLEWKWREGIQDIRETLDIEPDNVTALAFYSAVLPTMGRIDEAVRAAQRAYELDPFAPVAVQTLAWALFQRGRYEEAIEYMDKLVALDPDSQWASTFKVSALARSGRPEEALAVARLDAVPATPGADHSVGVSTVSLATIHAVGGDEEKARRLIGQLPPEHVPPGLWASLGEKDEAFAGLRRYVRERRSNYLMYLKTAPNWDPLRGDPRFDEILRQVGLSQ